jgi:hypothetical protein
MRAHFQWNVHCLSAAQFALLPFTSDDPIINHRCAIACLDYAFRPIIGSCEKY